MAAVRNLVVALLLFGGTADISAIDWRGPCRRMFQQLKITPTAAGQARLQVLKEKLAKGRSQRKDALDEAERQSAEQGILVDRNPDELVIRPSRSPDAHVLNQIAADAQDLFGAALKFNPAIISNTGAGLYYSKNVYLPPDTFSFGTMPLAGFHELVHAAIETGAVKNPRLEFLQMLASNERHSRDKLPGVYTNDAVLGELLTFPFELRLAAFRLKQGLPPEERQRVLRDIREAIGFQREVIANFKPKLAAITPEVIQRSGYSVVEGDEVHFKIKVGDEALTLVIKDATTMALCESRKIGSPDYRQLSDRLIERLVARAGEQLAQTRNLIDSTEIGLYRLEEALGKEADIPASRMPLVLPLLREPLRQVQQQIGSP